MFYKGFLQRDASIKKQLEYIKNSCLNNFRDPKTPPLKFFLSGIFLYFEGQRGPIHK